MRPYVIHETHVSGIGIQRRLIETDVGCTDHFHQIFLFDHEYPLMLLVFPDRQEKHRPLELPGYRTFVSACLRSMDSSVQPPGQEIPVAAPTIPQPPSLESPDKGNLQSPVATGRK